jgi:DNA-binding IscR family transcriptional regulator
MKSSDVLSCLSLAEQRQVDIHDRLTRRGHLVSMSFLRRTLNTLTTSGLAVTRRDAQGGCFYRLAEGEEVEAALDMAWSPD